MEKYWIIFWVQSWFCYKMKDTRRQIMIFAVNLSDWGDKINLIGCYISLLYFVLDCKIQNLFDEPILSYSMSCAAELLRFLGWRKNNALHMDLNKKMTRLLDFLPDEFHPLLIYSFVICFNSSCHYSFRPIVF